MKFVQTLTRDEMRHIMAGGACRIYNSGSGWESSCNWTVAEAQSWYENTPGVTGYCCASCGSGDFSNAGSCNAQ